MACADAATSIARPREPAAGEVLRALPLLTLHLTERCNSRCISCDYWRHGRNDLSAQAVAELLPDLQTLRTRTILISGGEPLLNPHWKEIAELLTTNGLKLWLLTSGLSLLKHASDVVRLFESVTVSLDGAIAPTYRAIRGVDAFEKVCAGIQAVADAGTAVSVRVTVQRGNYLEMPLFVPLAKRLGTRQLSFLAADVANPHAFGRTSNGPPDIALRPADLPLFAMTLACLEQDYAVEFQRRFIAESPAKLRRLLAYYRAVCGEDEFPAVNCNAPEFSAVMEADGNVRPCFFIPSPADARERQGLQASLNSASMLALRDDIQQQRRPECLTCVCSMWREPQSFDTLRLSLSGAVPA